MKKTLVWIVLFAGAAVAAYMMLDGKIPGSQINGNGSDGPGPGAGGNGGGSAGPRRPTVNVTITNIEDDRSVTNKKLRKRTEFMVAGLSVDGTLRNDHFELLGDDGDRYAPAGFAIYRQTNGEWKRSDIDVKSPRRMVLFSQTASGITRSIYTEGLVNVDKEQAIVLYFAGSGLTGKLTYEAEQIRATYHIEKPIDETPSPPDSPEKKETPPPAAP